MNSITRPLVFTHEEHVSASDSLSTTLEQATKWRKKNFTEKGSWQKLI